MTIEQWIAVISVVVAVMSLVAAIISFQRTAAYQRFDYATRLDIIDEIMQFGTTVENQPRIMSMGSGVDKKADVPILLLDSTGFGYRASLKNKGSRSISVHEIFVDYGAKNDSGKRRKSFQTGRFNLVPEEAREIKFSVTLEQIEKTTTEFGIQECLFWLRVVSENPAGKRLELLRPLGGFDRGGVQFLINNRDSLV